MAVQKGNIGITTENIFPVIKKFLYSDHEIFLREIVSNAVDATQKLRTLSAKGEFKGSLDDLKVSVKIDKEAGTLTVSDNGIGMDKEDIKANIGTIARSGTKAFLERLKAEKEDNENVSDKELIGQFGVGFYSAFMVAKAVTVLTRKAGTDTGYCWKSTGDGSYTLTECDVKHHGTAVVLELKDEFTTGEDDFLDESRLSELVKKYSDYIRYPIMMNVTVKEVPKNEDGQPVEGAEPIEKTELKTLNSMQPLWTRNKSDIKDEEYADFFRHQFYEWEKPMEVFHTKAEGTVEYTALLFIPGSAPMNLYYSDYEPGIQLYSRHVFIMDKCKDLLPEYLRFVKGLVDSPDLSLNISREMLQQSRNLKVIGKNLEKTILKTLARKAEKERPEYEKFWNEFGKSIKIGIYSGMMTGENNADKLKDLVLFYSARQGRLVTLKEYVEAMKDGQQKIYYAVGKDKESIDALPQTELLKDRDLDVLYLFDPVDEFAIEALHEYDGKSFHSVSRGDLDLDDDTFKEEKKKNEDLAKDNEGLLQDVKKALESKVVDVRLSNRLKSGAVCLVADAAGPSVAMEQAFAGADNPFMKARRILEINPHHELFNKLKTLHDGETNEDAFKEYSELLYDQALLLEGIMPEDPVVFAQRLAKMMAK